MPFSRSGDLGRADVGHVGQVVVLAALFVALRIPSTHGALGARVGVEPGEQIRVVKVVSEAPASASVERRNAARGHGEAVVVAQPQMNVFGVGLLDRGDLGGVLAELEQRPHLCGLRQLGIDRFVAPVAQR